MPSRQRALAVARRAVQDELARHAHQEYLLLARLAAVADQAVRQRLGRRRDLWPDLDPYTRLLPPGARAVWVRQGTGSCFAALNPFFTGRRTAVLAPHPDVEYDLLLNRA